MLESEGIAPLPLNGGKWWWRCLFITVT